VKKRNWIPRIIFILLVILAITFSKNSKPAYYFLFGFTIFSPNFFVQAIGSVLTITGLVLAIWARIYLGKNWSGYVTYKKNHELVTSGPYKLIRHPIYSALILMITGTFIYYPSVWVLAILIVDTLIFLWRIKKEEEIMVKLFGKKYEDYIKRTKRLIPGIW
jgi:protein-S-isoprenylcysteine O-methyltransferase Ste14